MQNGSLSQEMTPHETQQALKNMNYRDRLKNLGQISTVEQFFNYYTYMKKPTEMPREIDLFFFRENEIPMWEVISNILKFLQESP